MVPAHARESLGNSSPECASHRIVPSGTTPLPHYAFAFANGGPYMEVGVRRSRKNGIFQNLMCKGVNYWRT